MDSFFLQDIVDHPDDDAPRLIYADWLDENGDGALAEFIRVQCELSAAGPHGGECDDLEELQDRQDELFSANQDRWTAPFAEFTTKCVFYRGLIEFVIMTPEQFLEHNYRLFELAPVHSLMLTFGKKPEGFEQLARCGNLVRIRGLCLSGPLKNASPFFASPYLGNLEKLVMSECGLDLNVPQALASSPSLHKLKMLDVSKNRLRNNGIKAIAESENSASLQTLLASENEIRLLGARTLASSEHLAQLQYLDLRGNPIPFRGVEKLRERFGTSVVEI